MSSLFDLNDSKEVRFTSIWAISMALCIAYSLPLHASDGERSPCARSSQSTEGEESSSLSAIAWAKAHPGTYWFQVSEKYPAYGRHKLEVRNGEILYNKKKLDPSTIQIASDRITFREVNDNPDEHREIMTTTIMLNGAHSPSSVYRVLTYEFRAVSRGKERIDLRLGRLLFHHFPQGPTKKIQFLKLVKG